MTDYTQINRKLLRQQFKPALEQLRRAQDLPARPPDSITVTSKDGSSNFVSVEPYKYHDIHERRKNQASDWEGVFMWGTREASELRLVASNMNSSQPLVYAESDPEQFRNVLREVNLTRIGTESNLTVIFNQDVADLLLQVCLEIGTFVEKGRTVHPLVNPDLFARLLKEGTPTSNWIRMLLKNGEYNHFSFEDSGSRARLLHDEIYKRLLSVLGTVFTGSPGIRTFFVDSVQPSEINTLDPVSIVISCNTERSEEQRRVEGILGSNLPDNREIVLVPNENGERSSVWLDRIEERHNPLEIVIDPPGNNSPFPLSSERLLGESIIFIDSRVEVRDEEGWITALLEPMSIHRDVGISGTGGTIFPSTRGTQRMNQLWIPGIPVPVHHVNKNCMAVRRTVLETAEQSSGITGETPWVRLQRQIRNRGWMIVRSGGSPVSRNSLPRAEDPESTIPDIWKQRIPNLSLGNAPSRSQSGGEPPKKASG